MIAFADEIHDRPVPLSTLDVVLSEGRQFGPPKSASKEDCDHGEVSLVAQAFPVCPFQNQFSLIPVQPSFQPESPIASPL